MARKLRIQSNLFLNMDHIVSWIIENDILRIDTSIQTFHIGVSGTTFYAEIFVAESELQRMINDINAYFD